MSACLRERKGYMAFNTHLYNLVSDIVMCCTSTGHIRYANPVAQKWLGGPGEGDAFLALILPDVRQKGQLFFEAAQVATPEHPTQPWELIVGTDARYAVATFCGYADGDDVLVVGQLESKEMSTMQQYMTDITSELAEAQREVRRQNRSLHKALHNQRQLVRTIMRLTAPMVPIWDMSLLFSLIGDRRNDVTRQMVREIWDRTGQNSTSYLILDMSSMYVVDDTTLHVLKETIIILQTLGVQPIVADSGSGFAHRLRQVDSAVDMQNVVVYGDVDEAITFVGSQVAEQLDYAVTEPQGNYI